MVKDLTEAEVIVEAQRTSLVDILRKRVSYDGLEGLYNITVRKRVLFILGLLGHILLKIGLSSGLSQVI